MPEHNEDFNVKMNRLWTILRRRRWWAISTALMISLGAIAVSFIVPSRYRSEATIFVQKQRAPDRYVIPNDTSNAMATLDAMTSEILSSANLLRIIHDFDLYAEQRSRVDPGVLVTRIRTDIEVQPLIKNPERSGTNAFMIAFTGADPQVAQAVTSRLTSLFIQENQQAQEDRDNALTGFLSSQLESAKAELNRQEAILRNFKTQNLGQLPEQEQGNLQILSGLQIQLQNMQANLDRARQQRAYLQAMLNQPVTNGTTTAAPVSSASIQVTTARTELATLRAQRDDLLSRYSPIYPDVVSLNQRIAEKQALLKRLMASPQAPSETKDPDQTAVAILDPAAAQLRSQLEANRMEIADAERSCTQIESRIAEYRDRLNLAPLRAQQFAEVSRNYDVARQNYTAMLSRATESELATRLAKRQSGEQFQIIDPPSLPVHPSSPNRQVIALISLVVGLLLGVVVAFHVDSRDRSFRSEKEVRNFLSVPLLVAVPPLRTASELRRRALRHGFEWALGSVIALVLLASQFYVYLKG